MVWRIFFNIFWGGTTLNLWEKQGLGLWLEMGECWKTLEIHYVCSTCKWGGGQHSPTMVFLASLSVLKGKMISQHLYQLDQEVWHQYEITLLLMNHEPKKIKSSWHKFCFSTNVDSEKCPRCKNKIKTDFPKAVCLIAEIVKFYNRFQLSTI